MVDRSGHAIIGHECQNAEQQIDLTMLANGGETMILKPSVK